MRAFLLLGLLVLANSCFSQDKAAFKKLKNYYIVSTIYRGDITNLYYDNKTFKVSIDKDFVIPLRDITFHYEQVLNPKTNALDERVIIVCKQGDCIFERERLQNISTCSVPFHKKEQCLEFINLLSNLIFATALRK